EDLSSATDPLPPGTFTTSAHSEEWKITNALSAGPATITEHAAVIDWPANPNDEMSHGRVLRQASNGWTCMPEAPAQPDVRRRDQLMGDARQGQNATPAKNPSQVKDWF